MLGWLVWGINITDLFWGGLGDMLKKVGSTPHLVTVANKGLVIGIPYIKNVINRWWLLLNCVKKKALLLAKEMLLSWRFPNRIHAKYTQTQTAVLFPINSSLCLHEFNTAVFRNFGQVVAWTWTLVVLILATCAGALLTSPEVETLLPNCTCSKWNQQDL